MMESAAEEKRSTKTAAHTDGPGDSQRGPAYRRWFTASAFFALIGLWGLLAWIFNLPIGGEIRSDPFDLHQGESGLSRLADDFLSTVPHPGLARMNVVPTGVAGTFSPRTLESDQAGIPPPLYLPSSFANAPLSAIQEINQSPPASGASNESAIRFVQAGIMGDEKGAPFPDLKNGRDLQGQPPPSQLNQKRQLEPPPSKLEQQQQEPLPSKLEQQKELQPLNPVQQQEQQPEQQPLNTEQQKQLPEQQQSAALPSDALLAGLLLRRQDGKASLLAVDMQGRIFSFDTERGWQRAETDRHLLIGRIRDSGLGVAYKLNTKSSSWLVFFTPTEGNTGHVFPIFQSRDIARPNAVRWIGEAFQVKPSEASPSQSIIAPQNSFPNFGLANFFHPDPSQLPAFYSATFVPGTKTDWSIWAGGDKGLLELRGTTTNARDLKLHGLPTSAPIRSVFFHSDKMGWASSGWRDGNEEGTERPVILETSDGGATWERLPYRWLPAPWVFLSFVLAVGAFWRGTVDYANSLVETKPSIAGHGVSDNPIGLDDPDALGLVPIAHAMSRFLRNVQTTPSLAIGIAGAWGSGKSSLMRLVREDLEDRGVRSVEFNAWHHQQEESLLAALLTAVRAQAVPPIWTWSGLRVRLWSAFHRIKANPFGVIGMLFLAAAIGFVIWLCGPRLLELVHPKEGHTPESSDLWAALGISASVIAISKGLWTVLQPLSVVPAKLLSTMSTRASKKDLEQQLAFRYRFAREFRTFCRALRRPPHPGLVIFVDDLDRCGPRQTVDILEALNFVTTAGNCFIILGFDEQKVKAAIADVYKDTVLELHETDTGDFSKPKREDLFRFATNYLEKLVHLVVPVPPATGEAVEKLLGLTTVPPPSRAERRERRFKNLAAETAIPLLLLLGGCVLIGSLAWPFVDPTIAAMEDWRHVPKPKEPPPAQQAGQPDILGSPVPEVEINPSPGDQADTAPPIVLPEPAAPWWGEAIPTSLVVVLFFIIVLVPVAWLTRRFTVESTVNDSKDFRDALRIWDDLIAARRQTPRAIKRFMNRLRFLAMRVRDVVREEEDRGVKPALDEPMLVTFAAMEELSAVEPRNARPGVDDHDLQTELEQGLEQFTSTFKRSPYDDPRSREIYWRISGMVEERTGGDTLNEQETP